MDHNEREGLVHMVDDCNMDKIIEMVHYKVKEGGRAIPDIVSMADSICAESVNKASKARDLTNRT